MIKIIFIFLLVASPGIEAYSQSKIGIALPLMKNSGNAEEKKLGEAMLKGINDALEEYRSSNSGKRITIVTEDTKRDPSAALQIINKFGSDSSVIAIFGPVFSSELVNNAGAAKFHKIPVITPTATANFVAEKNEYIFQLNPTYDIRGRVMAKFALKNLGMKNFVVFSEDTYGSNFSESFIDEVNSGNGKIVFEKSYSTDKVDLNEEFDEIKHALLSKDKFLDFGNLNTAQLDKIKKLKFNFSYADSLLSEKLTVSIYKLFGERADRILDSSGIIPLTISDKSRNVIYGVADAVYIPIANSGEAGKLASQYFSSNINLPILGTSDWNNEKALYENRMYIKGLYFDSDFFIEENTGRDMGKMSDAELKNYYFGYDGLKFILDKISEGNGSRQSLNDAIEITTDYNAIHNDITIKDRTNHHLSIMQYDKGELKKIMDISE
ncbi:MAG: ABC transporter substrate-binding protein [bacterium]|nr:ABC transporter substrate-binding protein [bacterium]